jgi:phospholipid/cholesterol/gamma-HCH transport system substrate-binding protein
MIARRIKVQLVVFAAITLVGVIYAGLAYVGFHPFGIGSPYQVTAVFRDSGGIFASAQVTERGEVVGKVTSLSLVPGGVAVHLAIDPQYKIPRDSTAAVQDLSAVGEQYVDITPQSGGPPYLGQGGTIPVSRTTIPLNDAVILANFDKFVQSVNLPQLRTMVTELGAAFQGTGPALQRLIDAGDALTAAAKQNLPTDVALINEGHTVLTTQHDLNGELQTFTANLAQLSGQLVKSDPDFRALLDNGVSSAQQLTALLDQNRSALPILLSNLVTLAQIQEVRLPGLETIFAIYPPNVANGFLTAKGGEAHFSIATSSNPPDCTQGYNTKPRRFDQTSGPSVGGPANLNTYCTSNYTAPNAPDVRGAAAVPASRADGTAFPPPGGYQQLPGATYPSPAPGQSSGGSAGGSATQPAAGTAQSPVGVAPYNPLTGIIQLPNGQTYQLGDNGGQSAYLGDQSWQWLLLAPVLG